MRRALLSLSISAILLFIGMPAGAAMPAHDWSKKFGGANADIGYSVAVDAAGNAYVTGAFQSSINLGGQTFLSAGGFDMFLAKFDPVGIHFWSDHFGGTPANNDIARSVAVDPLGNGGLIGSFEGTASFGSNGGTSQGLQDIAVIEFGPTGGASGSGLGSPFSDIGYCIAIDPFGDTIITGTFSGTINFGGGNLTSAGVGMDIFVVKADGQGGGHLWSRRFGNTNIDSGYSLTTDAAGSVFVTGVFNGTVDFGGGTLTSAGGPDVFLAKFDQAGVHQWSRAFGGTGSDAGNSVATDDQGNVFLTGFFNGTASFGGTNLVSAGSGDIVLAKYDGNGTYQWSHRFGGTLMDSGNCVAVDASNNVVVTGYFANTANFGGVNLVSVGSNDIFFANFDPLGIHQWSARFGGTGDDQGYSLAVDAGNNLIATGSFSGTVNFGGADLTSFSSAPDVFLVRFGESEALPLVTSITDIPNDQGRQVKIRFAPSPLDVVSSPTPITQYEAYRRDDPPPAANVPRDPVGLSERELLDEGWTQVGVVAAHAQSSYGIDVPTIGDSTGVAGPYYSVFFLRAATNVPSIFFDSPLDSGQSLDNLAPGVPEGLLYSGGGLSWEESNAVDFDYFTVYGASSDDFGTATIIDHTVAPELDVTSSPYAYYFVTATDFSGNEGNPATFNTLSGVDGTPRTYVLSIGNYPNPFNPRTTVSYTLPSRAPVTVAIYDARGALVATLLKQDTRDAGAYRMEWDGRTENGSLAPSGLYFARIEHAGATRTRKMVLLK